MKFWPKLLKKKTKRRKRFLMGILEYLLEIIEEINWKISEGIHEKILETVFFFF